MNGDLYPPKDTIPDVSHPQVKQWVSEIDWSKVPQIPVAGGLPDSPHFPNCPPDDEVDKRSCWWSCDGCVQPSDVVTCPNQSDWGLTYDDGPSVASREMMKYLNSNKISATFFIVGSRVLEYPDILREQVAQGHHIAMHTWSHAGLTTLTNEQIVAEVRWSEKIIRDATGLTVKYIRPPYGDVDNRVREILRQMGYVTVIWTLGWDTNDWRVAMNQIQPDEIMQTFENALDNRELIRSSTGGPGGPVTLEHDLTDGTIYLSKQIIPMGMNRGLRPMSLDRCLNDASPYQKGSLTDQKANGGAGNHTSLATKPGITTPGNGAADYNGSTAQDTKNEQGLSMSKSEAKAMIHNGAQTMGYTVMGLAMVASLMMAL
ncbi:hypothetical protein BC939DRAFT_391465 [Gamsiella multidivaricata]|uniref:uncharacterized protein n=1 Tax=Gamsiella multidivaricata TaxID=101098 RepID=UPI0022212884|nr:uncharacterized protein BC939DRAFT_391465 [Gamsiella multidivaricata]KAI7832394.1 hypothetical protein BC939DRAFT_391465 [Gamsiella multidivaricata]